MEQRLSLITLGVKDLKKARAFYDALGWQTSSKPEMQEDVIAYDMAGYTVALFSWNGLADDAGVSAEGSGFRGVALAYNVRTPEEVDATLDEAVNAGGKLIKKAHETFWGGYSGYFADIDGHLWEVAHNPFAPLGENDEFQWNGVEA
ncbi:VOC family protein [Kordiimonas pumila]|uniref:VOC family protein n=1 Tax=Kordiimonas pumila TaxID=2161677 RepID=A0ABV7D2H4_9PROT|nr:VOC family protein [Kordiimonas pumila]